MKKRNSSSLGWMLLLSGLLSLGLALFSLMQYAEIKESLLQDGHTLWETLGYVYISAAVGSQLLLIAGSSFLIGFIMVLVGLMMIRRE